MTHQLTSGQLASVRPYVPLPLPAIFSFRPATGRLSAGASLLLGRVVTMATEDASAAAWRTRCTLND